MRNKNQKRLSSSMIGLLVSLAVVGLFTLTRELPSLRRYLRIRSM